jgi:glycosyltransferase involved in cell wall biosynthesis
LLKDSDRGFSADVIVAALNEEEGIGLTLEEISRKIIPDQVLVVDGHSDDRTVEIAKDLGAHILFQDGKGKGDAIAKAVRYIGSDVDCVAVTDADFTYPAEHIPEMMQILENHPDVAWFAETDLMATLKTVRCIICSILEISFWLSPMACLTG